MMEANIQGAGMETSIVDLKTRIKKQEKDTGEIKIEQVRQAMSLKAQNEDIHELKDAVKIIGDLREDIGKLRNQTSITWVILLMQTGSMLAFAWKLLEKFSNITVAAIVP